MWNFVRPWRGLNLSQRRPDPEIKVLRWNAHESSLQSFWLRERVVEWWLSLANSTVQIAARQGGTPRLESSVSGRRVFDILLGPWDLEGKVIRVDVSGRLFSILVSPQELIDFEVTTVEVDLTLNVARLSSRVGRVLWVVMSGQQVTIAAIPGMIQASRAIYHSQHQARRGVHLSTISRSSIFNTVPFSERKIQFESLTRSDNLYAASPASEVFSDASIFLFFASENNQELGISSFAPFLSPSRSSVKNEEHTFEFSFKKGISKRVGSGPLVYIEAPLEIIETFRNGVLSSQPTVISFHSPKKAVARWGAGAGLLVQEKTPQQISTASKSNHVLGLPFRRRSAVLALSEGLSTPWPLNNRSLSPAHSFQAPRRWLVL